MYDTPPAMGAAALIGAPPGEVSTPMFPVKIWALLSTCPAADSGASTAASGSGVHKGRSQLTETSF